MTSSVVLTPKAPTPHGFDTTLSASLPSPTPSNRVTLAWRVRCTRTPPRAGVKTAVCADVCRSAATKCDVHLSFESTKNDIRFFVDMPFCGFFPGKVPIQVVFSSSGK